MAGEAMGMNDTPKDDSVSVTHIAGLDITIADRYLRQRCAWCDEVLIDYDLAAVAVPIGHDPRPGTWAVGGMVRVDGPVSVALDDERLPDDACSWAVFADPAQIDDGSGVS